MTYPNQIAAVNRVFADPLMSWKNTGEKYWTSDHEMYSVEMQKAARAWSPGEQQLALLASEIWENLAEGAPRFDMVRCMTLLDPIRLNTVLEALAIYAGREIPGTDSAQVLLARYSAIAIPR